MKYNLKRKDFSLFFSDLLYINFFFFIFEVNMNMLVPQRSPLEVFLKQLLGKVFEASLLLLFFPAAGGLPFVCSLKKKKKAVFLKLNQCG